MSLYPLRFDPIFKSMLWGGRRLPAFLNRQAPHDDPIGEAWVLSDVEGSVSRVAEGPLAGVSLRDLVARDPERLLGDSFAPRGRFPLLFKFIDARQELSVQVHPNDEQAAARHGPGQFGKTEAWVVLDACPHASRIYAGVAEGVSAEQFRQALRDRTTSSLLHSFIPTPGDCLFLEAGTVHAVGANLLIFEVQQTSDITYRLYDWDRIDARTGQPRQLHIDDGLACADFARGRCQPILPIPSRMPGGRRERLVACRYFSLERHVGREPFAVGLPGQCRVVVCSSGSGALAWRGDRYPLARGDVILIPAEVGACQCEPDGEIELLECGLQK